MKTVKFTGTITLALVKGEGEATTERLAEVVRALATGAAFGVDANPDRAPEIWALDGAEVDPATAVVAGEGVMVDGIAALVQAMEENGTETV